ncbi:13905_t:CDS:2 [Funneliformis geosporum]|nr:13905_t:CDS:2 [Funneliformis geosporum]
MSLSKEILGRLQYPGYWNRDSDFWGDVQNWNVFYITKVPDCTPQSSHSALTSELEILLNRLPSNSKKYKTANFIRKSIQVSILFVSANKVTLATPRTEVS